MALFAVNVAKSLRGVVLGMARRVRRSFTKDTVLAIILCIILCIVVVWPVARAVMLSQPHQRRKTVDGDVNFDDKTLDRDVSSMHGNATRVSQRESFLAVAAMYEGSSTSLCEWIEHYMMEGVEQIYIGVSRPLAIDLTPTFTSIVTQYKRHVRVLTYENQSQYYQQLKRVTTDQNVTWLLVVQMDEFVSTYQDDDLETPLVDMVREYGQYNVNAIYIPWLMYGSAGFKETPASLINGLTYRFNMSSRARRVCTGCLCPPSHTKQNRHAFGDSYFARVSEIKTLYDFTVDLKGKTELAVSSRWNPFQDDFVNGFADDSVLWWYNYKGGITSPFYHAIVSFKYFYQSEDYWLKVKCSDEDRRSAIASYNAGNAVSNTNLDISLKLKRGRLMQTKFPQGAVLMMEHANHCLSWRNSKQNSIPKS
eukprot:m.167641 g.167641  ORF g.167641 m.167641 type:complete len:422 (-) comp31469_c0_seq2:73-1338(-)